MSHVENFSFFLEPTHFCNSKNPQIRALAEKITEDYSTEQEKARELFSWVRDHILYRVGKWQNSALDTLVEGEGTCTNKANLLVALLRSIGIPAGYGVMKTLGQEYFGPIVIPAFKRQIAQRSTHVYATVYLDGQWFKCDPSLDIRLSLQTAHFNPQSHLVKWNGAENSQERLDPTHILEDKSPVANIDKIISKKPRNASGIVIWAANIYVSFLRHERNDFKDILEVEDKFGKWFYANYPIYYCVYKATAFWRNLTRRTSITTTQ